MDVVFDQMMEDYAKEMKAYIENQIKVKNRFKKELKGLINVHGLFRELNDTLDTWMPLGYVEVYEVTEKSGGYSNYQHARIKDGKQNLLYMKQECQIRNVDHEYVWQAVGCCGDDYSGFILFPLSNGRYLQIEFTC